MASEDPFAQMGLANLYIGEKPPEQQQGQQQPSYDVWGLTPTAAPPAPGTAAYAPNATAAPAAAQPVMNAPPPLQAPPGAAPIMQQSPVAVNPYAQQAYPPQQQQQQQQPQQVMNPPPIQVQQQQYAAAYGAPAPVYAPAPAATLQAPPPQPVPTQPAAATAAAPKSFDPFAAAAAPASPTAAANPFGAISPASSRDESPPPQRPANAPESQTYEVADATPEPSNRNALDVDDDEADFWSQMGFAIEQTPADAVPKAGGKRMSLRASVVRTVPKKKEELKATTEEKEDAVDDQGLPVGGDYYDATLPGGYFGAVLKRATELDSSIFSTAPKNFTKTIGDRPVVAYTSQDSVVDKAGIAVGDVVLQVQKHEVNLPKTALSAIRKVCDQKCGYRGIELKCWTPPSSIEVTLAENQCMVTYHGHMANVPSTSWEWKSKYVVIGGVVAHPYDINMYYTKRDYDVAVSEINAKQPKVSVKVKSYNLLGAKLLTPKPKTVFYSTQSQSWYFIMVQLREKSRVVKIAHPLRDGLQPVLDGIERALKHHGRKKFGV